MIFSTFRFILIIDSLLHQGIRGESLLEEEIWRREAFDKSWTLAWSH